MYLQAWAENGPGDPNHDWLASFGARMDRCVSSITGRIQLELLLLLGLPWVKASAAALPTPTPTKLAGTCTAISQSAGWEGQVAASIRVDV